MWMNFTKNKMKLNNGYIEFKDFIKRAEVKASRHKLYMFGDNLLGIGYGGQAKEMRGEYNTIGIPTKKSPAEYLTDNDYEQVVPLIKAKFSIIEGHLQCNHIVVIPSSGIGTGLADLPNKAPKIWEVVEKELKKLGWEKYNEKRTEKNI